MFEKFSARPADPLLALIGAYAKDPRPGKVDLGVGVYRDENGATPVMKAVKIAEQRLVDTQSSKSYIGPEGDPRFLELLAAEFVPTQPGQAVAGVQTPGGTGALRLASDLIASLGDRRVWVGVPTWPNHPGIFDDSGVPFETYPYFDRATQTLNRDAMFDALGRAPAGDVVLLHGCCHNPTGAVLTPQDWQDLGTVMAKRGLLPLVDFAYGGLGAGLEQDKEGLKILLSHVPEALVAVSCSKSFSLYRDRIGAVFAICQDPAQAAIASSNLSHQARVTYSMPPDHGASVVRTILEDAQLTTLWKDELATMQARVSAVRSALGAGLGEWYAPLAAIARQQGMFSLLPLREEQILTLRQDHGIYMPLSGRVNIAGLKTRDIAAVVENFKALEGPASP